MVINFFNEGISFLLRNKRELRKWICSTISMEGKVPGEINFIFCDDDYLANFNFKYLNHKTLTDILTFPLDTYPGLLSGDIFISVTRVKENALKFNERMEDELHRVMIHGILHLIGYGDASKRDKLEMTGKENLYLDVLRTA
jgi:probable rRNA maturation factor